MLPHRLLPGGCVDMPPMMRKSNNSHLINARERLWVSRLLRVNFAQVLRRPIEPARLIVHYEALQCPQYGNCLGLT
jgi:hypothetical protein